MSLINRTDQQIQGRLKQPVRLTLTGGAAMSFYSDTRQSGDVDAIFSHAVSLPPILIEYADEQQMPRKLVWDTNYSPAIGLMHPDALQDAHHVGLSSAMKFDVFILSPLDLATSKLGRYAENDAADIKNLFAKNLISAKDLELRAIEALGYFIGDADQVYHNICLALELLTVPRYLSIYAQTLSV